MALAQLGVPDETVQLLKSFQEEQTSSLIALLTFFTDIVRGFRGRWVIVIPQSPGIYR